MEEGLTPSLPRPVHQQVSGSEGPGWSQRSLISNKSPSDANAAGPKGQWRTTGFCQRVAGKDPDMRPMGGRGKEGGEKKVQK